MDADRTRMSYGDAAAAGGSGARDTARDGSEDDIARESTAVAGRFMDGDPEAVATVSAWATSVVAHRIWGFQNVEDIVQATLLALVENLRKNRFTGVNLRAYVRRIAKNMCISHYRKTRTRGEHVSFEEHGHHGPLRQGDEEVERNEMISSILKRLNEPCRRIILLAYVQGFSRREISTRLGISEEAARVRLYRCVRDARSLFDGSGEIGIGHA